MLTEMSKRIEVSEHIQKLWRAPVEYIVIPTERFLSFFAASRRTRGRRIARPRAFHTSPSVLYKRKGLAFPSDIFGDISFIYMVTQSRCLLSYDTRCSSVSVPPISFACVYFHQCLWVFEAV